MLIILELVGGRGGDLFAKVPCTILLSLLGVSDTAGRGGGQEGNGAFRELNCGT